jgi:hypothetical protein
MEKNAYHPFIQQLLKSCEVFAVYPVSQDPKPTRDSLPAEGQTCDKSVVWTILKENIGKDLWSITMPVQFNEPVSFLQRVNEHLEYQEQLKMANKCMDSYMRLALVFSTQYMLCANLIKRVAKTFNPLLGETYEYINKDLRCVMEQVSHHPPICAFHVESNDFLMEGNLLMKTSLKLTSFKLIPVGELIVKLKSTGETFTITRPLCRLYNFIVGKMYAWFEGSMECTNKTTGDRMTVIFKKKGWTSKSDYEVDGQITDAKGTTMYLVQGLWKESLDIIDPKTKEVTNICRKKPDPSNSEKYFSFTAFAINANHLNEAILRKVAPTDSRLRPDLRAYEHGNIKMAAEFKTRLEESQRARRKANQEQGKEFKPLWFEYSQNGEEIKTRYKGEYWKCWESGKWPAEMLDLYN